MIIRQREEWAARGVDSGRSGQLEEWTARGVDNGSSGQREEWTTGGVDSERSGQQEECTARIMAIFLIVFFLIFFLSLRFMLRLSLCVLAKGNSGPGIIKHGCCLKKQGNVYSTVEEGEGGLLH